MTVTRRVASLSGVAVFEAVTVTPVTLRGRGSYILRTDSRSVGTRQSQAGECPDVDDTVHRVERTIVLARQTLKA